MLVIASLTSRSPRIKRMCSLRSSFSCRSISAAKALIFLSEQEISMPTLVSSLSRSANSLRRSSATCLMEMIFQRQSSKRQTRMIHKVIRDVTIAAPLTNYLISFRLKINSPAMLQSSVMTAEYRARSHGWATSVRVNCIHWPPGRKS